MVSLGPYEYEDTNVTSNFRKRTAEERLKALEAEIDRLRELVRDAYEEGWDDAFFWSEDRIKPAACDEDWDVSQAKKALEGGELDK